MSAPPRSDAALPTGEAKRASVDAMFDSIAPRYDRMNRIISCGQDVRWRRRTVATLGLPAGSRVLDLGCGTGDLCRDLTTAGYRAVGLDRSAGMLAAATTDVPLARADAEALPVADRSVDGVVSGFALRNFVDLSTVLDACVRALRPGGRVALLDAAVPDQALLRLGNALWFRGAVPLLGRLVAGQPDAYAYLPRSMAYLPGPDALLDVLRGAGLTDVTRQTMTGGSVQILSGTRP